MTGITTRKLIGTLAIAFVLSVGAFGTAKAAQAFFLGTGRTLIFDAVVGSVTSNSVTVYTTSTTPITVTVNRRTAISGGGLSVGESVKIIASRQGGGLVARVINGSGSTSGYGTAGDLVLTSQATVVSKGASSFVANVNGVDVTYHVTSATRFFGTSFAQLATGQRVVVIGQDTGSSSTGFVAQDVFR